jgi:hypothetical protein
MSKSDLAAGIRAAFGARPATPETPARVHDGRRRAARTTPRLPVRRPVNRLALYWRDRPESLFSIRDDRRDPTSADAIEPYAEAGIAPREGHNISHYAPPRQAPRSPRAMIEYLAGLTHPVTLEPGVGGTFLIISERGALDPAARDAIDAAAPLLGPLLAGTPRRCERLGRHKGEVPEAVGLSGTAALCQECLGA